MKKHLLIWSLLVAVCVGSAQAGEFGEKYGDFKSLLNKKYGLSYNLDYSLLAQHASPNGRYNSVQSYLSPSVTWTTFDNKYGIGTLNASYNSVFYGRHNASDVQNRTGMVTAINDFDDNEQSFSSLYYNYQLPGKYSWLNVSLGQYTLYAFDGNDYNNNQQVNFVNYALSQNGSATYADAGLGAYLQATPGNWLLVVGMQDASNIEGQGIKFNTFKDKHYTSFGQLGYNLKIKGLGQGQYSVMIYNQPRVKAQPQSTTGWSLNMQQNLNEKIAVFGRINGVSGSVSEIKNSYVAGLVFNNPLNRNSLDQIGLAYAYNDIDETAVGKKTDSAAEQVLEAYWSWGISQWATLTPDFQFYINPALNHKSDYGTAASLRLSLFF